MKTHPADPRNINTSNELAVIPGESGAAAVEPVPRRGAKAWLLGAYTLLTLWGVAYLLLYFTDRLPF